MVFILWIRTYGYPGAFLVTLLEFILPSIPGEIIFSSIAFPAQRGLGLENTIRLATVEVLGSAAGSIAIYFVVL